MHLLPRGFRGQYLITNIIRFAKFRCFFVGGAFLSCLKQILLKFKAAQNSKNLRLFVVQVLNSKLGITLRVSVTSATILTAQGTQQAIKKKQ